LGLGVEPLASTRRTARQRAPRRYAVPVLIARNGAISKKLQRMIRQSRAEARKSA
jgi:hypothetical protein